MDLAVRLFALHRNLWEIMTMTDPIVAEVRSVREKLAARFNFDVKAICEHARKRQKRAHQKVVSFVKSRRTMATASS